MDKEQENEPKLEQLEQIDPLIHAPTRLKVMTYLYLVENIDFVYLKRVTGLTWGNLSRHLTKLEEAGYLAMEKAFVDKKPRTLIWITDQGKEAFQQYKENLKEIFDTMD